MTHAAIDVSGLKKRLGQRQVLAGIDLSVPSGSVLALLGENGAGKTTTVRILSTLLALDDGDVRIDGIDVTKNPQEVKRRIGLAGQYAALDDRLTAVENLRLLATLRHLGRRQARAETDRLLDRLDLRAHAGKQVRHLSGGLRRRVDLAASLMGQPSVLFLDEPTTGLDPSSRIQLWQLIRDEVARGVTVLLTTQYLEEADQLADDVAVLVDGRIAAHGSPAELKRRVGGDRLQIRPIDPRDVPRLRQRFVGDPATSHLTLVRDEEIHLETPSGFADIAAAAGLVADADIPVEEFGLLRPTLDDVFLRLTDRKSA